MLAQQLPLAAGGDLLDRLIGIATALRRAGVPASQSATMDALRALAVIDLLQRTQVREALAATYVSSASHRSIFDELFALYFPATPVETAGASDDVLLDRVKTAVAEADDDALAQIAHDVAARFGRVEARDGTPTYFAYRAQRALDRVLVADEESDSGFDAAIDARQAALRATQLRTEVDRAVRQRRAEISGPDGVANRIAPDAVEDRDLLRLAPGELDALHQQLAPLMRRLATRVAVRRKRARHGRLDVRATIRRSLSTGGVPFDPVYRHRHHTRPELFVLCDLSGSVANFARFTLLLAHALHGQYARVRSFAFVDTTAEVTRHFDGQSAHDAIADLMSGTDVIDGDGTSDYGRALERFRALVADDLSARSTLLILGDGRNNFRQANAWVLAELARRTRHIYWLNPEPRHLWNTGDSIADSYARHVDAMVEVRNLRQLGDFVARLV